MITNERELKLYYDPESNSGRMTVAYAKSLSVHVSTYAFDKVPSTSTGWKEILNALGLEAKDILNKAHPYYQANIRGKEYDEEGWINIVKHNSQLIKAPIAMKGNRAILCQTPTDVYKLV